MEILSIADVVTTTLSQGTTTTTTTTTLLGFDKSFPITVTRVLSISAGLSVDTIERPRIRHNRSRSIPRSFTRKKRRTRKRSQTSGGDDDADSDYDDGSGNSFFGDGNEGPFGGGGGGGGFGNGGFGNGGGGWNFDGNGGSDWDDASSDPAFDFVYKVLSWIILSNCLHFAFKKVVRIIADGGAIGDPSREKVV